MGQAIDRDHALSMAPHGHDSLDLAQNSGSARSRCAFFSSRAQHLSVLVMGLAPVPATFGPPMPVTWSIGWEEDIAQLKGRVAILQAILEGEDISKSAVWDYCDPGAADDVIGSTAANKTSPSSGRTSPPRPN